jgi:hypothetical protein
MLKSEGTWRHHPKGKKCLPLFRQLCSWRIEVRCERRFDWLHLHESEHWLPRERKIAEGLREHCRVTRSSHPIKAKCDPEFLLSDATIRGRSKKLEFDFFLPEQCIAIEFDERQHFTAERASTFNYYDGLECHYDINRWRDLCSPTIKDSDPPCRDWQRAFRDAVRDIRAANHDVKLIRVYYLDVESIGSPNCEFTKNLYKHVVGII